MKLALNPGILAWITAGCIFVHSGQGVLAQTLDPTQPEIDAWVVADAEGDGHLRKPEFIVFVRAMAGSGQKTAQRIRFFLAYGYAFSVADKNRDGILTPQEMRAADGGYRAQQ